MAFFTSRSRGESTSLSSMYHELDQGEKNVSGMENSMIGFIKSINDQLEGLPIQLEREQKQTLTDPRTKAVSPSTPRDIRNPACIGQDEVLRTFEGRSLI